MQMEKHKPPIHCYHSPEPVATPEEPNQHTKYNVYIFAILHWEQAKTILPGINIYITLFKLLYAR
jgi:hypothetical protein